MALAMQAVTTNRVLHSAPWVSSSQTEKATKQYVMQYATRYAMKYTSSKKCEIFRKLKTTTEYLEVCTCQGYMFMIAVQRKYHPAASGPASSASDSALSAS